MIKLTLANGEVLNYPTDKYDGYRYDGKFIILTKEHTPNTKMINAELVADFEVEDEMPSMPVLDTNEVDVVEDVEVA